MSQGIFIKGAPIVEVNGTYNVFSTSAITTARVWDSVDKLYRVRYTVGTENVFRRTTDITIDPEKDYYQYSNEAGYTVFDTSNKSRLDELPDNIYEKTINSRWEIVPIISSDIAGELEVADPVYVYYTTDVSSSPDDAAAVWINVQTSKQVDLDIEYFDDSSLHTEVSDPIIDEVNGTVTTITTITNIVTGAVYKETSVVRNKTKYDTKQLTRYDNMVLTLGKVYRFQFVSDFASIGYQVLTSGAPVATQLDKAGIYRVDKIMSYTDLVTAGIDLYSNLYQPCRVAKEVYIADKKERLIGSVIYKLVDPTDETVIYYMPQIFIKDTPDPSVEKYQKMLLTIDLGVCPSPELLDNINEVMTKVFEKKWGIVPASNVKLSELTVYDNVWLTLSQRQLLEKIRQNIQTTSEVDLSTVFSLTTTNRTMLENIRLKGRVNGLEQLLIQYKTKK